MASAREILKLIIQGDAKGLKDALKQSDISVRGFVKTANGAFDRVKKTVFSLKSAIAALGIGAAIRSVFSATIEAESVLARLDSVLKSTGHAAGFTREEIIAMASKLQDVTTFGDEAIISMENLLLSFTNIKRTGGIFEQATETALDMSQALGQDLKSSAIQLGKALQDPVEGVSALSRVGVNFTDAQKDLIRSMVDTGNIAGAQRLILQELQVEFGGAARAARDSLGGSMQALSEVFGDLLEQDSLGGARSEIESLITQLKDPQTKQAFGDLTKNLIVLAENAARALIFLSNLTNAIRFNFTEAAHLTREVARLQSNIASMQKFAPDAPALPQMQQQLAEAQAKLDAIIDKDIEARMKSNSPVVAGGRLGGNQDADDTGTNRAQEIKDFIKALEEELTTTEETSAAIARYKLEQLGASEADILHAQMLVEATEAKKEDARIERERAQQLAENRKSDAQLIADLQEQIRLAQLSEIEREKAVSVSKLSADATEAEAEQVRQLAGELHTLEEKQKETSEQMNEFAKQAAHSIQGAFSDFFFDPFDDGLKGLVRGFANAIRRMLSDSLALQTLKYIGNATGFSFLTLHTGGMAGGGGRRTQVSPLAFIGAQRYHTGGVLGLGPDEVPIIGKRNEEMLTTDDPRHRFNGGGITQGGVRIVNLIDPSMVASAMQSPEGEKAILNVIKKNPEATGRRK